MKPTDRLPFSLHSFRRITWASEPLEAEWSPRLQQIPPMAEKVFTEAVAAGLLPVHLTSVAACHLYQYKKEMYAKGLFAEHIPGLPSFIQRSLVLNPQAGNCTVITGHRREVIDFIENLHDITALEEITGLPQGTLSHWKQLDNNGLEDIHWAYLAECGDIPLTEKEYESNMLNPCWRKLGIAAVPHIPFSLQCEKSLTLAAELRSLAQDRLSSDHYRHWYEILSWPAQWSALHGIAEIKTPLFKMAFNTDATASKYTVRYRSETYPEQGMHGLLFPYKPPQKLHISSSEKFKRGIEHINRSASAI